MSVNSISIPLKKKLKRDGSCQKMTRLFKHAGVFVNGDQPWDIHVHDKRFYNKTLAQGSMGLGESYVDGWWECDRLDELVYRLFRSRVPRQVKTRGDMIYGLRAKLINFQSPSRAYKVGQHHYDMGNDLYRCMLDNRMIYSCGYWKDASTLDAAQEAKLDLVCRKLKLEPGMRVLDIGCGWGGAARFVSERYQVQVVGITVSAQQAKIAEENCRGLPVEIYLQDYRNIKGTFDRVYSLGMFEHVGYKNYSTYMQVVTEHLKEDGLFLLHTIGTNKSDSAGNPWVERYIFPNSMLPSAKQVTTAAENRLVIEDWHNFGADYDKTLLHWFKNFDDHWESLKPKYDERFYRMWKYYLLTFAGAFRARENQLWQIVFSPKGVEYRYDAPR